MKDRYFVFFAALLLIGCAGTFIEREPHLSASLEEIYNRLFLDSYRWNPLLDEQLPRLIVLICTGASLAAAGIVMQALFQNPLASPMVLGVTSGGSIFVLAIFILGWHISFPFFVSIGAITGCLFYLFLVYSLSRRNGSPSMNTFILTGIALSTVTIAIQSAILYALRHNWTLVQLFSEWEAGSSTDRTWYHVHLQLPLTLVGLSTFYKFREELNILSLGDEEALNLGVDVKRVRLNLFIATSLLVGGALAAMGIIAFFGLVLPHILRKVRGPDHQLLIPLSIISGAAVLTLIDTLMRLFRIHLFSLGTVSAILGGIFFFVLLMKIQGGVLPSRSRRIC